MLIVSELAHADIASWFGFKTKVLEVSGPERAQKLREQSQINSQQASFHEVVFHYFNKDFNTALTLIEVGLSEHGFEQLTEDNFDRLTLMKGACLLQLGLYRQSQLVLAGLLEKGTSEYVQGQTWFFIAKAGFENKQAQLTNTAYDAIIEADLTDVLFDNQWHELLYLAAHTNMQKDGEWKGFLNQLPETSIYRAYLWANKGSILFNASQYEQANLAFTQSKQHLLNVAQTVEKRVSQGFFQFLPSSMWFQDQRESAENQQKAKEINALFDHINHQLAKSLVQHGDLPNAIAVLQTIGKESGESNQALLSYGWANAREKRWQVAETVWQYLADNNAGLISLQANYGLAYAFSQQDQLGQAFYALQRTSEEIDASIDLINEFSQMVEKPDFFDTYDIQWPDYLLEVKLEFLAANSEFDAPYLLDNRSDAKQLLRDISQKQTTLKSLKILLTERQATYQKRLQDLSLAATKASLESTLSKLNALEQRLLQASGYQDELSLAMEMAGQEQKGHLKRLKSANQRHFRLSNDTTRKRPLKASYAKRLERLTGIIEWQLMNDFVATKWQHQKHLISAQQAYEVANERFINLETFTTELNPLDKDQQTFQQLEQELKRQSQIAQNLYEKANSSLQRSLLSLLESHKKQLQEQSINTKLAMLRIQDLRQEVNR